VDVSAKGELEQTIGMLRDEKAAIEQKIEADRASLAEFGKEHASVKQARVSWPFHCLF
jgi:prefoldin subunit 5